MKKTSGSAKPANTTTSKRSPERPRRTKKSYDLRLYVAGQTPKSIAAFANLKKICEEHLAGQYDIPSLDQSRAGGFILNAPWTLVGPIDCE